MLGKLLLLFGWKDCPTQGRARGEGCIILLKVTMKKKYISHVIRPDERATTLVHINCLSAA